MPCITSFTTAMKDAQRLEGVLRSMGAQVDVSPDRNRITAVMKGGQTISYYRSNPAQPFRTEVSFSNKIIAKKYAEASVRAFAKNQGFQVSTSPTNPNKIVLRRG